MNRLDRFLQDETNRLLDRIAGAVPEGAALALARQDPELRELIDGAEERLAVARQVMLDCYRQWQEAAEACENLWRLCALEADELAERRAA
jgi:hypothetical protein